MKIDESWYRKPADIPQRLAAGGVVVRLKGNDLLVALVGEPDVSEEGFILPKGGVEAGESLEDAARREIEEETGLTDLTLLGELGSRQRLNFRKTRWQTTHYFLFLTRQQTAAPADLSHHYELRWFPLDHLPTIFWPEQTKLIESNRDKIRENINRFVRKGTL
jgi:8-oxo-dGTP pyrophosphatase MutT (NUDIX family)